MENKTAITQLWEDIAKFGFKVLENKQEHYLKIEKEQLCDFYVRGRNDNHLDWYPEKHAKEEYDLVFNKKEDGKN